MLQWLAATSAAAVTPATPDPHAQHLLHCSAYFHGATLRPQLQKSLRHHCCCCAQFFDGGASGTLSGSC